MRHWFYLLIYLFSSIDVHFTTIWRPYWRGGVREWRNKAIRSMFVLHNTIIYPKPSTVESPKFQPNSYPLILMCFCFRAEFFIVLFVARCDWKRQTTLYRTTVSDCLKSEVASQLKRWPECVSNLENWSKVSSFQDDTSGLYGLMSPVLLPHLNSGVILVLIYRWLPLSTNNVCIDKSISSHAIRCTLQTF